MSRRRWALGVGLVAAAGAAAAVGGVALRDPHRRERMERSFRVWRLSTRRGLHWAVVWVRGRGADEARRAELETHFAIRTAADVAAELGNMKGAIMKAGQMVSFIAEGLPPEAQAALATLQADVPPMAPSLAEQVVTEELGAPPERLFLDWDPEPVAAASIGQVHRAVLPDGRLVAVKVQYPGVDRAIGSDLDNAELLYGLFSQFALKGFDPAPFVDELRARMGDELDYRLEASNQDAFWRRYRGHPFVRIPAVVFERSGRRVLTSEWVEGMTWATFDAQADEAARQRAGEVLFRFAQAGIHHFRLFNGDPHPGNYRFHEDGSVTFLDFGLVKRWSGGEWESLEPALDAILANDPQATVDAMVASGFLAAGHDLDPQLVFDYVSSPYRPYLVERFAFSRSFVADTVSTIFDLGGPYAPVVAALNMPPSFVILDRVVWGISALLGRLGAEGPWRGILQEYRHGGPPVTDLGRAEAAWEAGRAAQTARR